MDGETGLHAIYASERAALLRFVAARTGDPSGAEDIVQELWLKLGSVEAGPIANGRAYLFRMTQNLILDRLREQRRRMARDRLYGDGPPLAAGVEPVDPEENAEARLIARGEAERLAGAIAKLPPGAQQVLRLHKIDGLAHSEVAARLGISRSAVEKHMAVAMAHLRRAMTELG